MNQEIDWYDRSRQRTISQNTGPMVPFNTDFRRGFRDRDYYNSYSGRGNNQFNQGHRNNFRHSQQQTANSYGSAICRDSTSYDSVRPGFPGPVEPTGPPGFLANNFSRDPSAPEVTACIQSRPPPPPPVAPTFDAPKRFQNSKVPPSNISTKNRVFASSTSAAWKPSIGHGPPPLPPISNLEIHTSHELPPVFQLDTRVPPSPNVQVDLARPPPALPGWFPNGVEYPGAPFLPPQPPVSAIGARLPRQPDSQQMLDERSSRWSNNKQISPAPDVKSTASERSDPSGSESLPSFKSTVKEEVDDDDDVICVTDLNAKSNSAPLDTFIRFLDANYSALFQIINPVSRNDWLPIMETFLQNLDDELFQIDDKIRLWMHLNMVMISATQGSSFVNIENYLDLMDRFFEIYFNLMKQIFQQAWKLGQVPDCKDIAVNCILVLSRCFLNRYDRILNCFLERQIPMDVKGLPQVWFQVLSYLLTAPVHNFLEEDGYRIYLIWQKFRTLCDTTRLVQKMDMIVNRRLSQTGSMDDNFYIQDILMKQRTGKSYNWWDMIQDYFKYMEGKKRTALESYNYSYMYPGNPDSPTTCDIAPARISHTFKPFYESLFAWSRDDEMARLFDRVETDFDVAKREMEKGYKFPEIDLTVRPDYVDPSSAPSKPKHTVNQTRRVLPQKQVTTNKSKILPSSSTIVISDSEPEDDDILPVSQSSRCNNIVDLTSLDKDMIGTDTDSRLKDIVTLEDEVIHDTVQERTGQVGNCAGDAQIEAESKSSNVNSDAESTTIETCPEEAIQEAPEIQNKTMDTLTQRISEQPIEIANNLEDEVYNEIQFRSLQPPEQGCSDKVIPTQDLTLPDSTISKHEVVNNLEERLLSPSDILNNPLQIGMLDAQKIEPIPKDVNTVVQKPNGKITNGLFDAEPTVPYVNNTDQLVPSASTGLDETKSSKEMIDIVMAEGDSNDLIPDRVENSSKMMVSGSSDVTEQNLHVRKYTPSIDAVCTPEENKGDKSKTDESVIDSLEDGLQAPADTLDVQKNSLIQHETSFETTESSLKPAESYPSHNKLNGLMPISDKNESNEHYSFVLSTVPNGETNKSHAEQVKQQQTCNTLDESSGGILEEHFEATVGLWLDQSTPSKQDVYLTNSGGPALRMCTANAGIPDKSDANVCHEPNTDLPEESLLKDLPIPSPVEVNCLDSHLTNKQETPDQIKSSKSDVNIICVSEAEMDTSAKCNVNDSNEVAIRDESCDMEASQQNDLDTITTNEPEVHPNTAGKTDSHNETAQIVPTERSVTVPIFSADEYQNSGHYDTPVSQVAPLEHSSHPHEVDISRPALVEENQQESCAAFYACAYDQEPCTKDDTECDGSVPPDECSHNSNSGVVLESAGEDCKKSKRSRKRKTSNCEASVDAKRSNVTWWTKTASEELQAKFILDDMSDDIETGSDDLKLSEASFEIASPPFEMLNKENVKSHFEKGMKRQTLADWKYGELSPSPVSTTAIDTPSSVFESSNHESPIDLSNLCKSGIDHAENAAAEPDTKLLPEKSTNCRDLYEGFLAAESEGGEVGGLLTPEWTYDQQQFAIKDTVKAKEVPGTSQSFAPEISHISVLDDTGVHSEESSVIYRLRSAAVGFSKKRRGSKHRSEEKHKVHFNLDENELFQNSLEGPVGKPMPHSAEIASNYLWNDSEPPYAVSVKPDSQLMEERTVKLESIFKKPKFKNVDNHVKINNTVSPNASIEQRSLYEKHHEDVYYQSYFNQSPSVHLNEIGADPYPYLGLPVLFGDGFKTPSLSEDFGLVGLDSLGVMKDNDLVNNFNPYEPAEVPLKYPLPESTPTTLNEFQVQRESGQEVNLALPLKKRKPTEEEELNIIVAAKNMEDLEQSQKLQKAYPAERQMSIADVQRVCTKIRTLAARKEYPTSEQVYQKPVQPPLAEEQNVNYQKYPDQCPDQRGNIRNFFINVHSSHSAKPFWVMLGPIDSEGQCTAPQEAPVEQNSAAQANMPVLPPVKAKRGRKPSTVIKPPGVKRGRGRPRKNPPILTKTTN